MDKSEIKAKKIKTYRLPLIDYCALYYNTFKYLLFAIIMFVPIFVILAVNSFHWKFFLYLIPLEGLFIYFIIRGLLFLRDKGKYITWVNQMKKNPDHATMYTGAPGMGKTLVGTHAVYAMAKGSWEKLQFEYFCLIGRMLKKGYDIKNITVDNMPDDDREIYESYQYMITHEGIPCLGTNIPVYSKRYRRYSYKMGPSYLRQERRASYRLVGLYDEIGTVFNFELSNDKSDDNKGLTIADMVRFCRQHAEFRFVGTEQEGGNMYKGIRNVVARYREYTSLEFIFKPKFLQWLFDKLSNYFVKKMKFSQARMFGNFMNKFKKFLDNVGFFKVRYKDFGRKDELLTESRKGEVIYLPCCAEFIYDTRAFRFAYTARYMPIVMQVFKGMKLSAEEASAFLRANYPKEKEERKKGKKDE